MKPAFTLWILVVMLVALGACVPQYGAQQPTVDASGANAAMTMTAVAAMHAAADAYAMHAGMTLTAQAQRTQNALTLQAQQTQAVQVETARAATAAAIDAMRAATNTAATPTVAAQWTQSALEIQQAQANQTATAESRALTLTARAAEVHGTVTAIAMQAHSDAQRATATVEAESVRRTNAARMQWLGDAVQIVAFVALIALGLLVGVVMLMAALKRLRRPAIVRSRPGEQMYLIHEPAHSATVHDPARQPTATASTEHTALPPGIAPALQAQVTAQAQQLDALYLVAQGMLAQGVNGNGGSGGGGKPTKEAVIRQMLGALPGVEAPARVIVLPEDTRALRSALTGQLGAPPTLAGEIVEGEFRELGGDMWHS
jgi:hypothetical protein